LCLFNAVHGSVLVVEGARPLCVAWVADGGGCAGVCVCTWASWFVYSAGFVLCVEAPWWPAAV